MRTKHLNQVLTTLNEKLERWRRSQLDTTPAGKAFAKALAFQIERDKHADVFAAIVANLEHVREKIILTGYICASVSCNDSGTATIEFQKKFKPSGPPIILQ